jgi:hypothetical protein
MNIPANSCHLGKAASAWRAWMLPSQLWKFGCVPSESPPNLEIAQMHYGKYSWKKKTINI